MYDGVSNLSMWISHQYYERVIFFENQITCLSMIYVTVLTHLRLRINQGLFAFLLSIDQEGAPAPSSRSGLRPPLDSPGYTAPLRFARGAERSKASPGRGSIALAALAVAGGFQGISPAEGGMRRWRGNGRLPEAASLSACSETVPALSETQPVPVSRGASAAPTSQHPENWRRPTSPMAKSDVDLRRCVEATSRPSTRERKVKCMRDQFATSSNFIKLALGRRATRLAHDRDGVVAL